MRRSRRTCLGYWWLVVMLAVGAAVSPAVTVAQTVPLAQYPEDLVDLSTFCATHTQFAITPDSLAMPPGELPPPAPGAQQRVPVLAEPNNPLDLYLIEDETDVYLSVYLKFAPSASLDLYGTAAWVGVQEGTLVVVSCTGDLIIDGIPGDGAASRIPAGIGAKIEARTYGAFIALDQMSGPVVVLNDGDGAAPIASVQVQYDPTTVPVCDPSGCWDLSGVAYSDPGGGGCVGVRCWHW